VPIPPGCIFIRFEKKCAKSEDTFPALSRRGGSCPPGEGGEDCARRLELAGNRVVCRRMEDALHGFFSLPVRFEHVRRTYELINDFLEE